jgi:two-component system, OmpR family, response regulator ArlR
MTKLLVIEDEEKLARFVELELLHEGYAVEKASDGRTGLQLVETGGFDLVLLDIMLPELNGMEVLRRLRRTSNVPVILLTARDAVMDKVTGLDTGADDYITKPFSIEELLARIRTALRKKRQNTTETLYSCGPVILDTARHIVTCGGTPVELTAREFMLLQYFMANKAIVLSRETLLEHVWGYDYIGETNVVDVYIRYLRQKIDEACNCKILHTVRGIGYALREPEDP